MANERRTGAGPRLAGILERSAESIEAEAPAPVEADLADEVKGRGPASRKPRPAASGRKAKGRTIYLDDGLFERILVQAHRKDRTISEYVAAILDRQVPDHRVIRSDGSD
jgi:hypothetical protein